MCTLKPESQGYYGNLQEKTLPELKDMLASHKNLVKKEKFIESLPDKGRKIRAFYEKLTQLVAEREAREVLVFDTSATQSAPRSPLREPLEKPAVKKETSFSTLRDMSVFPDELVTDHAEPAILVNKDIPMVPSEESISDSMRNMKVSSSTSVESPSQDEHYVNSYDRVIRRAEEKAAKKRQPFKPYCDLKVKSVAEMPGDLVASLRELSTKPSQASKPTLDNGHSSSGHTETGESGAADSLSMSVDSSDSKSVSERKGAHSEAGSRPAGEARKGGWRDKDVYPEYCYQRTKLIPMEESFRIQQEQQQKHEVLKALQAASRLASSLGIKMEEYKPDSLDMHYREPQELDSDDDDDNDAHYGEGGDAEELES